jgi:hypothetical protein
MRYVKDFPGCRRGMIACFVLAYTSNAVTAQEVRSRGQEAQAGTVAPQSSPRVTSVDTEDTDPFVQSVMSRSWESDTALAVKVTFQVQRQTLKQFLSTLQQQTGILLQLAPGGQLHQKQLTARGTEMPLAEVMSSLARLYGITWIKQEAGAYSGCELALNELERGLLTFGELDAWRDPRYSMSGSARTEMASAVMKFADQGMLNSEMGQPLNEMPEEVQRSIKRSLREQAAWQLVGAFTNASLLNLSETYIRMERAPHAVSKIKNFRQQTPLQSVADPLETPFTLSLIDTQQHPILPIANIRLRAPSLPVTGGQVERN